jgi:hypothetical protein
LKNPKQLVARVEPSISFWAYFAGFFDGEGHLETPMGTNSTSSHLKISQSGYEGKKLLEHFVFVFKDQCGLPGKMRVRRATQYLDNFVSKPKNPKPHWELQINRRDSVEYILRKIFPYLHIKKVVAQDALRFGIIFPQRGPWLTRKRYPTCGKGHAFTEENTMYSKVHGTSYKSRTCRKCMYERTRRYRSAKKAASNRIQ